MSSLQNLSKAELLCFCGMKYSKIWSCKIHPELTGGNTDLLLFHETLDKSRFLILIQSFKVLLRQQTLHQKQSQTQPRSCGRTALLEPRPPVNPSNMDIMKNHQAMSGASHLHPLHHLDPMDLLQVALARFVTRSWRSETNIVKKQSSNIFLPWNSTEQKIKIFNTVCDNDNVISFSFLNI